MDTGRAQVALVVTHDGTRPVCRVRGEIDKTTCSAVAKVLFSFVEIGETDIDLDLSEVDYVDADGAQQLLAAQRAGLHVTLTAMSPAAKAVLDAVTGQRDG